MSGLVACPFCREMFERGEARACPECGLVLEDITKLGKSSLTEEEAEPIPPEHETLPWTFVGRGRAPLVVITLLGLGAFFLPWVREFAPELQSLTGFDLARRLSWMWASFAAWFVMLPLVITRRTIHSMRGSRLAIALLALIVIATSVERMVLVPESTRLRPVRIEWGYGLYATLVLGLVAFAWAIRFGGGVIEMRSREARTASETVH